MLSISDLVLFHAMEMILYDHLVRTMGADPELTKQVFALWLWMESIGYPQLVRHIYTYKDDALRRVVAEGEACIQALCSDMEYPAENNDIPITASLAKEPINLQFFRCNRDVVIQGMANISNNICNIIFDDNIMRETARDPNHPMNHMAMSHGLGRQVGEGTSGQGSTGILGAPLAVAATSQAAASPGVRGETGQGMGEPLKSSLNPFATPWSPSLEQKRRDQKLVKEPEEKRSIFLSLPAYYPLSKEEIVEFFTSHWGNCIEKVIIEGPLIANPVVLHGRIVFSSGSIIPLILNGQPMADFVVKGKYLRAHI